MAMTDTQRFVELRKQMTAIRTQIETSDEPMGAAQRDVVQVAMVESLAEIAATLNGGLTVEVSS